MFFCSLGNTDRRFSHDGLAIEAALTGQNDVSILHIVAQPGFFQYDFYTGFQRGIKKRQESKA